uniref:Uncharacterized protein n=1 Tax=viral metagenome TaxID=1070528 RepID=A0A6C0LQ46_9ZZZZ
MRLLADISLMKIPVETPPIIAVGGIVLSG